MPSNDLRPALAKRWDEHAGAIGAKEGPSAAWRGRVLDAYGAPQRRYHGLSHLAFIFTELDALEGLADAPRLWFAAWFHDLVYVTTRKDNEARSAERALEALAEMGAPVGLCERVAALVNATARHHEGGGDAEADLFLDIDMAILGAPGEIYDAYAAGVRQEYAFAPEPLYRAGRRAFLAGVLARPRLFLTARYETRLGPQARANIARELAALAG